MGGAVKTGAAARKQKTRKLIILIEIFSKLQALPADPEIFSFEFVHNFSKNFEPFYYIRKISRHFYFKLWILFFTIYGQTFLNRANFPVIFNT